jgi:hypothetical protein
VQLAAVCTTLALAVGCNEEDGSFDDLRGVVRLYRMTPERSQQAYASTTFYRGSPPIHANTVGGCWIPGRSASATLDAGTITVTIGDEPFVFEFDPDEPGYAGMPIDPVLLEPGEIVTAGSAGSSRVPAFEATTEFPEHLSGIAIPEDDDVISVRDDVRLTWTPSNRAAPAGATLRVTASISGVSAVGNIGCETDDSDGEIVVSADLLEQMYDGQYSLVLARTLVADLGVGDARFRLRSVASSFPIFRLDADDDAWNGTGGSK